MRTGGNRYVALHAWIVGGGQRPDGLGNLGVFLDHDPSDFGVPPEYISHHVGRPKGLPVAVPRYIPRHAIRTGLSEAIETDLADDSYDLLWENQLAQDDPTAICQLHQLLETTHDPIDRHFQFASLEHRLYRSRNTSAAALDEFDAVCHQHDAEMDAIRAAFLDKFGAIPLIEMYRQATIRCAKAKQWHSARQWAERGISVYGDQAHRPEVVADLRKRLAHATAKIEAVERPEPRKPRGTKVPAANGRPIVMETLSCTACGASFQRVRSRGRKPLLCPTCRDSHSPALIWLPAEH